MLTVTIVTHAAMPDGAEDDRILAAALHRRGAAARFAAWDDAGVDWRETPVTVIRSTWDYHLKPYAWFDWLDRVAPLTRLVNPAALVRWNSDKAYLLDLADAGVPIVPTMLLGGGTDIVGLAGAQGWDDVVIKPAIGASSRGTRRFTGPAIADGGVEHARALLAHGRALLQPYQPAIETKRERSLVLLGGTFSHAFSKPGFHAAHDGEAYRAHAPSPGERSLADAVLAALPEPALVARIDIVPGARGPLLMEAELIEPQLALPLHPDAGDTLAAVIASMATENFHPPR